MFEIALLSVALVGSAVASAYDLKTTEVPDWVFYAMFGIGLPLVLGRSILAGDFSYIVNSLLAGGGLMGFGYMMYKIGQWGGADAVLLGILGFLIPVVPSFFSPTLLFPFPISLLFNVYAVGMVYMLAYSIIFSLRNKHIIYRFKEDIRNSLKLIVVLLAAISASAAFISTYFSPFFGSGALFVNVSIAAVGALLFFLLYKFARTVENFGFKRKIPVSKLREGDMLLEARQLDGISRKTLMRIKNSGKKFVWIKEGVRFIPAYLLALLFTLYYGDAISYLMSIF